jgi:cell division protein DivIC
MAAATVNRKSANTGTKRRFKLWMMFIVLFMGWAAYTIYGQSQLKEATNVKLADIQKQLDAATQESASLNRQIERLNDQEYIKQLATKELGMVKQGEQQIFSNQ